MYSNLLDYLSHQIQVLKKVVDSPVYVAGGALRDWDNDKPINDIDFFIPINTALKEQARLTKSATTRKFTYAGRLETLYRTPVKSLVKQYGDNWPTGLKIYDIIEINKEPYKLQFILYKHTGRMGPVNLLSYFDINFCKISYDGERTYRSEEYKKDLENKTLTYNPRFNNERTQKRIEKFLKKYPDFIKTEESSAIFVEQEQEIPDILTNADSVLREYVFTSEIERTRYTWSSHNSTEE